MKISIAMTTYNGSRFLEQQLKSLLRQTKKADEIIIVDDGSSDDTVAIIKKYLNVSNTRIKLYINEVNLGVFKNFEKAISLCKGDIIFCCDQDDVWQFDKIEKHINNFDDDTMLVFSNASVTREDIKQYISPLWENMKFQASFKNIVYLGGSVAGCCMSFRKELLDGAYPFPDQVYHDDWLITLAALKGKINFIDEELMYYRQHGSNVVGIVRGNKFSYYKSLFTNPDSYLDHYKYIYTRHKLVLTALVELNLISTEQKNDLESNLEFAEVLANIRSNSRKVSLNNLKSFKKIGYYKKYAKFNYALDRYFVLVRGK